MSESQSPTPRGVRCEVHGLLYDPNRPGGCVLCRREAGQPAQNTAPATTSDNAMGRALAATAGLVLVTSLGLYAAHQAVVDMISGFSSAGAFEAGLPSDELETLGVDPRTQKYLDAIEELDEIEAKRYGTYDETGEEELDDEGYSEEY